MRSSVTNCFFSGGVAAVIIRRLFAGRWWILDLQTVCLKVSSVRGFWWKQKWSVFVFLRIQKGRSHNPWQTFSNGHSDISRTFKLWSLQILCNCLTQYLKSLDVYTFFHSDAWMHPKRFRNTFQIPILFRAVFRPNPLSGMAWQCWKISWVWEFQRWSQQMQRNNWQHRWQNLGQHWFMAHEAWKGCNFFFLFERLDDQLRFGFWFWGTFLQKRC